MPIAVGLSPDIVEKVWQKARIVPTIDGEVPPGLDPAKWRQDECGAWMCRPFYGDKRSEYGWEVGRIKPATQGGSEDISNLRPLQRQNHAATGDGPLRCAVTASGVSNVPME